MRKPTSVPEPIEELDQDLIADHHHDAPCECGHRHAEHSMFGSCHGCNDCTDDDGDGEHEHPYERCACRDFKLATEVTFDATLLAMTG